MKIVIGQLKNKIENFRLNQQIPGSPEYKKALKEFQMLANPVTIYRLIDHIERLESKIDDRREVQEDRGDVHV